MIDRDPGTVVAAVGVTLIGKSFMYLAVWWSSAIARSCSRFPAQQQIE